MGILHQAVVIGLLFYALSRAADIIVVRVRRISELLGLSTLVIGVVLGILTTLPEIAIAFNTVKSDAVAVSLGNLFGGISVILGLVLGLSLIFNRHVDTSHGQRETLFLAGFIVLPFLLALDGRIGAFDGGVIIVGYLGYLTWLYLSGGSVRGPVALDIVNRKAASRDVLGVIAAAIAVILLSDIIVAYTLDLLEGAAIPQFLVGLMIFAVGTNLPEIAVSFRSWRHRSGDISVSHLMGSSAANVLVIGILGFIKPTAMMPGIQYWTFAFLTVALVVCLAVFARTGRRLTAVEGAVLLGIFVLATASQAIFLAAG